MGQHQKRISVPRSWPINKKEHQWVVKTNPGTHNYDRSVPLTVVIRDMLKLADNNREVIRILHEGSVQVDGIVRRNNKFPVGFFDVVTIPAIDKSYRMLLDHKGRLNLHEVADGNVKLSLIKNKTIIKGGNTQLNLYDGTNILSDDVEVYNTKDSILLSLPGKEIVEHIPYKVGNLTMIVGGQHAGEIGTIKEINPVKSSRHNTVIIEGTYEFETIEDYCFMIGVSKPAIDMGGA